MRLALAPTLEYRIHARKASTTTQMIRRVRLARSCWGLLPPPEPPRSNPGSPPRRCRFLFSLSAIDDPSSHRGVELPGGPRRNVGGAGRTDRYSTWTGRRVGKVSGSIEAREEQGAGPGVGAVAGLASAGAALGISAAVHTVVPSIPFPPVAVAQAVIRGAPGGLDAFFITNLQHAARPAAVIGAGVGFLVVATLLGLFLPRLRRALGRRTATRTSHAGRSSARCGSAARDSCWDGPTSAGQCSGAPTPGKRGWQCAVPFRPRPDRAPRQGTRPSPASRG